MDLANQLQSTSKGKKKMKMPLPIASWSALLVCTQVSCAFAHESVPPTTQREMLNGTLWVQRAPEFQLAARGILQYAAEKLPAAIRSPGSAAPEQQDQSNMGTLPPAVIVDLDETMLDNSPYQAHLVASGLKFGHDGTWEKWIGQRQAQAVPGAVDFANAVIAAGATIFYVTNRDCGTDPYCKAKADTMANMRSLQFPRSLDPSAFLFLHERPEWVDDKTARRRVIAKDYRIVMLVGDDMRDFMSAIDANDLAVGASAQVALAKQMVGQRWFVVPNPMYGSWQRRLAKPELPANGLYSALLPAQFATTTPNAITSAASAPISDENQLRCPVAQSKFTSYSRDARRALWSVYTQGGREIYCSAPFNGGATRTSQTGLSLNIEHVVPQMKLRRARAAGGDLHNLWPSIEKANSARAHFPLVDDIPGENWFFATNGNQELANCDFEVAGSGNQQRVEPSEYSRGRLARSLLHILIAYPAIASTRDELETYLSWHRRFPVAEDERARNTTIAAITGQRNPFIDHPERAKEIVDACYRH